METPQRERNKSDAQDDLNTCSKNFSSAKLSGDVILVPTILRPIIICLIDLENHDLAAKLGSIVPKLRGLGEKGSMLPGYAGAVLELRKAMSNEQFEALAQIGQGWELMDVVGALHAIPEE